MQGICLSQHSDSSLHQQQRLLMTTAMQQAIYVMQLPILELAEWVKNEIEKNPALEVQLSPCDWEETPSKRKIQAKQPSKELLENLIPNPPSLFNYLLSQAHYHFTDPNDLNLAQWIIGH